MNFDAVSRALELSAPHEIWRAGFEASSEFAQRAELAHLRDRALWMSLCARAGFSDELSSVLWEAMRECAESPALRRLMSHARYCWFEKLPGEDPTPWPMLPPVGGDARLLFYALVLVAELPRVLKLHEERGIPAAVTAETLSDLELWIRHYRACNGVWGFNEHGWIIKHWRGELFALGRLQFEMCGNPLPFHVWREEASGAVTIFAEGQSEIRGDGQFASADGGAVNDSPIVTVYAESETAIRGHAVNARGEIARAATEMARAGWKKILWPGAESLSVHIPARGALESAACEESFRRAEAFFPRHFPERAIQGYWIESWLMDPQLTEYLPAESNIARFQKFFHIVAFPHANDLQIRQRVFGNDQFRPVSELPQKTELQRIVVRHILKGGTWRGMGGVRESKKFESQK